MPFKNRHKHNQYMKNRMKEKRELGLNKRYYALTMLELTIKAILPKHIYQFKDVMKELLKTYFAKKFIIVRKRTELITESYSKYANIGLNKP